MFLMNTSPLVALPRRWEPCPQPRNCRYPVCFSESEEDLARTAVSAKVQMIINNLQSEEVALGASSKYGCIVQKKQKAAKHRGHKFRRNNQLLQEHINYTFRSYPTDSDGMEFGPLALNSDTDDSVDRDIEEAIQEYLRNKGQNHPPLPNSPKNLPSKREDHPAQQKFPSHDAACHLFPAGYGPVSLAQPYVVPGHVEGDAVQWASSPRSMSSDDSFEQSIKAEIEQFLKKKKQQERKKRRNKPFPQKEVLQAKLALSQKGSLNRGNPCSLRQRGKAYFPKQHPELQSISTATCLGSTTREDPAACKTERETGISTPTVCDSYKKSRKRPMLCGGGREGRAERTDLSDSSSDDGIEEAIQRYQLEKMKKAAESRAGCVSLQKEGLPASKTETIPLSAWPEITQRAQRSKRKGTSAKAAAISGPGRRCSPEKSFAKLQASCRADTAAELMCAEAILDISKTILPLPTGSDHQLFSSSPPFSSQSGLPSQYESDPNVVDSDDSIEQEIRAFLAVKARTEHLIAKSTFNLSLGQSRERTQSSGRTFPKCLNLPLIRKKTLKRKRETVPRSEEAQLVSEVGCLDENLPKSAVTQLKNKRTGKMVIYPKDAPAPIRSISVPCSRAPRDSGCLVESVTPDPQKYGADDKSSSFDSDEDLDTAIKDLLSSKRKLKKKPKDQRTPGQKKDPFGDAGMRIFGENEGDGQSQAPALLKKCLVGCRRDDREGNVKKGPPRKPKGTIELEPECKKEDQTKPVSGREIQQATESRPCLWAVASWMDDSSSVDSDDSIEEEIQRFLAEKAKASTTIGGLPDAPGVAGTLGADKPQAALLKAEWQLLGQGSPASEIEGPKVGRLDPPRSEVSSCRRCTGGNDGNTSRPREQARAFTEDAGSQAPRENPPASDSKETELPLRRAPVQRKDIWEDRIEQRTLAPRTGKAGEWRNYRKATPSFERKRLRGFKRSSKYLAGLKGGGNKRKSELFGKRPQDTNLALLDKHGGTLADNMFGEGSPPKEVVSSRTEAGLREANQGPRVQAGSLHFPGQERDGSTQETTVTTEVVGLVQRSGVECNEGGASQSFPSQGPGIEETPISPGVTCVRNGKALELSSSWGQCEGPEGPCDLSLKGKRVGQARTAEELAQKLLEGGPAELGQWGNTPTAS